MADEVVPDLATLYRDVGPSLLRMLRLKLGTREEAEDVTQEAFAKMLGHERDAIRSGPSFLFRIASNLAIDRLRQRRVWREAERVDPQDMPIAAPDPMHDRMIEARDDLALLPVLLAELPDRCRQAFVQHRFEARGYAEIAADMGISESMVRKYVLRAARHCMDGLERMP